MMSVEILGGQGMGTPLVLDLAGDQGMVIAMATAKDGVVDGGLAGAADMVKVMEMRLEATMKHAISPIDSDLARHMREAEREEALSDIVDRRIDAWDDKEWHQRIIALLEHDPSGPVFSAILRRGDALTLKGVQTWVYQHLRRQVELEVIGESIDDF